MKVRELIEALAKLDPELTVYSFDTFSAVFEPIHSAYENDAVGCYRIPPHEPDEDRVAVVASVYDPNQK